MKSFYKIFAIVSIVVFASFTTSRNDNYVIYSELSGQKPSYDVFNKCLKGLSKVAKAENGDLNTQIITLIDYRLASGKNRLWVIDLKQKKVLFNTLVAHGKNSGEHYAQDFSNQHSSYKSSLGFYLTGETYFGKHGLSLNLDGLEMGFNNNARERRIVVHGADYVSTNFIEQHNRLGRSFGCPSVSMDIHKELIETIKGKTCLFIYYPNQEYEKSSKLLN